MAECWEVTDVDISQWGSWCRFFATDDDRFFVVDCDVLPAPAWITTVIRRNTAVFWCSSNGGVIDLVADFEYKPMTTAEQAIELMGFELVNAPSGYELPDPEPLFSVPNQPDEGSTA